MRFAFDDGQAVSVRADAAIEHRVAVEHQMLGRDRRGDVWPARAHEVNGIGSGDMLEHDLQRRKVVNKTGQCAFDKHGLAVKNVDVMVGDFAVDEQRHADPLHGFEHGVKVGDVHNAVCGPCGRMCGV